MADELQPHTKLRVSDARPYAIMPGDWVRVDRMRDFLEDVRDVAFNREIKSIVGTYKGIGVLLYLYGHGWSFNWHCGRGAP